jgi:hypothetical protein
MEEPEQQVRETTTQVGNTRETTQEVRRPGDQAAHEQNVIARLIWFIAGVLLAILGIRFILVLLGANQANGFANAIFNISHPFVAPFFSLFGYQYRYGASKFEAFTLVAMLVYALIAYGLARLVTITQE